MKLKKCIKIMKRYCTDDNSCKTCPFHNEQYSTIAGKTYYTCEIPELPGNWDYDKINARLKALKTGDKK